MREAGPTGKSIITRRRPHSSYARLWTKGDERGVSLIWVAVVFFFLIASAALAIDSSGAFNTARTDQNTADLTCLAAVRELPNQSAAVDVAVQYVEANWPQMTGATLNVTLPTATYTAADGSNVFIDTRYDGADNKMYVRVTEVSPTTFGRAIGRDTITVVQEAACEEQEVRSGTGILPAGALGGSWNGRAFDCLDKHNGNCGAIDSGSGAKDFKEKVANGLQGNFLKHHGNRNALDPDNGYRTLTCLLIGMDPCNVLETETGEMVGPWKEGQRARFKKTVGADCIEGGDFNCDSIQQVFGDGLQPLSAIPDDEIWWWHDSLYGSLAAAKASNHPNAKHWFYNGDEMKCDSPRIATIPIVSQSMDWDLGGAPGTWPNGKKSMKIIGFYTVYIREPAHKADVDRDAMDTDIVWFGPDARCNTGEAFQPLGSSIPVNAGVRLVAP